MPQGDYPCDLIGYERAPQHPCWPNEANIAVQFVHDRVWVARRIDIARHWIATHPPTSD